MDTNMPPDSWENSDKSGAGDDNSVDSLVDKLPSLNVNAYNFVPGRNIHASTFVPSNPTMGKCVMSSVFIPNS